jgi:hypothetical protein
MKTILINGLLVLLLGLIGCNLPATSELNPQTNATDSARSSETTRTLIAGDSSDPNSALTQRPVTTNDVIGNVILVGNLELAPFAPPWFDVALLPAAIFSNNDLLRIDAPITPTSFDFPGINNVFGAVTRTAYADFEITASFNFEGGACTGIKSCANINVQNCIVFDFMDIGNLQIFCVDSSALFWVLIQFKEGVVVYHSSVQKSDAVHDMGQIFYDEHPIPNDIRLKSSQGIIQAYINGEQMFQRDRTLVEGRVGVGCINYDFEGQLSNCEVSLTILP